MEDKLQSNYSLFRVQGPPKINAVATLMVATRPRADTIFVLRRSQLEWCTSFAEMPSLNGKPANDLSEKMARAYCPDLLEILNMTSSFSFVLAQVGDSQHTNTLPHNPQLQYPVEVSVPHFAKTRVSLTPNGPCPSRILWKLNTLRHWKRLPKLMDIDIPWEQKMNVAVFRGADSGMDKRRRELGKMSHIQRCANIPRCRLVQMTQNSSDIDAALVRRMRNHFPDSEYTKSLSIRAQLRYKIIIVLPGNDVATSLKWALLSQSVVLMPKPIISSWLMEEWLLPYHHYIPLSDDLSNVEEQVQWVWQHDAQARQVALQGSLWVHDMLFHDEATEEERHIQDRILELYSKMVQAV